MAIPRRQLRLPPPLPIFSVPLQRMLQRQTQQHLRTRTTNTTPTPVLSAIPSEATSELVSATPANMTDADSDGDWSGTDIASATASEQLSITGDTKTTTFYNDMSVLCCNACYPLATLMILIRP
jgi:hypothetical protein